MQLWFLVYDIVVLLTLATAYIDDRCTDQRWAKELGRSGKYFDTFYIQVQRDLDLAVHVT